MKSFDVCEGNGRLKNMITTKEHMLPRIIINVTVPDCAPIVAEIQCHLEGIKKITDWGHRYYEIRAHNLFYRREHEGDGRGERRGDGRGGHEAPKTVDASNVEVGILDDAEQNHGREQGEGRACTIC